jgi:hypothetical protein
VTLTFERRAALWATGPLILVAADGAGIHMLPESEEWAGVVVVDAGDAIPSVLRNVEIRATAGPRGVDSGVTFSASAVYLVDCRLLGSTARRAIGVTRGRFSLLRTEVAGAAYDGLTASRAAGRIAQSAFHDIVGSAIVLEESQIAAQNVTLSRVNGVGVLADSGSTVDAREVRASNVGVALASTDMSLVDVLGATVEQAWVAAFLSYLDDLAWGQAVLSAARVTLIDDSVAALVGAGGDVRFDRSVGTASAGELVPELLRRRTAIAAPLHVTHYSLGPFVRLAGYDLLTPELSAGDSVELVLYWQALAKLDRDYTVFVHILDESGQIAGQWDAMPRDNTFPTTAWPVGELVDDLRRVPVSPDVDAGTYRIALGMYELQTGDRLPVRGPDAEPVPDGAVVLDARVWVR